MRNHKSVGIYTSLGFRSSHPDGNLRTVEIIGVPGQKKRGGECYIGEKMERFFDDSIARPIFQTSRHIPNLDWQAIKIWLYTIDEGEEEQGYQVPQLNEQDLEIQSNISDSNLKLIYVLDNELPKAEYRRWKKTAESLFTPLFRQFVAPPEFPSSFPFPTNPFSGLIQSLDNRLDPYAQMKRELFFDALIIQVD